MAPGLNRRLLAPAIAVPAVALIVFFSWAFDRVGHQDRVLRHVTLAGIDVSGMRRPELQSEVRKLATNFTSTQVVIEASGTTINTTTQELGLRVDEDATTDAVLAVGRRGFALGQFTSWGESLFSKRSTAVRLVVDRTVVSDALYRLDSAPNAKPIEPGFTVKNSQVIAVDGSAGSVIDPIELTSELAHAQYGNNPLRISLKRKAVSPRYSLKDAQELVEEAKQLTAQPLTVAVNNATITLAPETLRSWLQPSLEGGILDIGINSQMANAALAAAFEKAVAAPTDATVTLDPASNAPVVVPGKDGAKCCAPEAAQAVLQALRDRPQVGIVLPTAPVPPGITADDMAKLGIKELVGTFTTKHVAGQPRVTNIHRMADLVRGQILKPGETLSINQLVGPRTEEKGFVLAPAIVDGNLHDHEEVGGGVSQFMTTLFNAAFFAGLDYGEYQSHTIYINRYPYGREATINWPAPDLQVKNTTPYGILVWNSYTDTSITVSLYSTKHFSDVKQGAITEVLTGLSCTDVRTERIRTFLDGRTVKDTIRARYQAADGLKCTDPLPEGTLPQHNPNGPPVVVPTTTTTVPPTTTLAPGATSPPTTATTVPPTTIVRPTTTKKP
ncbi:MAG: VanW family protein [Acidimicrobiia bacterium]